MSVKEGLVSGRGIRMHSPYGVRGGGEVFRNRSRTVEKAPQVDRPLAFGTLFFLASTPCCKPLSLSGSVLRRFFWRRSGKARQKILVRRPQKSEEDASGKAQGSVKPPAAAPFPLPCFVRAAPTRTRPAPRPPGLPDCQLPSLSAGRGTLPECREKGGSRR